MAAQVMAMPEPAVPQVQSKLFGKVSDRNIQRSSQTQAAFPEPNALIKRITAPDKRQQQQQPIQTNSLLQRSIAASNDASRHLESRLSSSKGGGSPLSEEVRSFMEPRFGADLSSVRTHTDSNAIQMNKELGAQAFAHGSNIYFAEGKSPGKDELTAHELTHTIQQGGGLPVKTFSNQPHKGNKLQAKVDFSQPSIHLKENRQEQPVKEAELAPQAAPSSPTADVTPAGQQAKSIATPAKTIEKPAGGGAGAPSIPAGSSEGGAAVTSPEGIKQAVSDGAAIASSGINGVSAATSSEGGAAVASPEGIKQAVSDGAAIASSGMDGGSGSTFSEGGGAVASPEGIKQAVSDGAGITGSGMDGGSGSTSSEDGGAIASPEGIKQAVSDGAGITGSGMDGESSATSPENDPGFKAVANRTKSVAQQQKQHQPAGAKSAEAQAAAVPPGNEVESQAQDKQVQEMNQQQPGQFNAATFKAALMEKIAAVTPQTLEEADNFKNNNKIDSVKGELSSKVTEEKKQASGPIEEKAKEQPDTSGIAPKPVTPLTPEKAGSPPSDIGAEKAAPKPKPASEVSLQEGSQSLDQQMIEANVTEEQLASSNEPQFQGALKAKKDAQTNAVTAPQEYRQQEQGILKQAQAEAQTTAQTQLQAMHGSKEQVLAQVLGSQGETKTKDEQERANVATKINGFYETTKSEVETILNNLDNEVIGKFDAGAAAAKQKFETFVAPYMEDYKERYDGLLGAGRWLIDKLLDVPPEVTAFFKEGRELYLAEMDKTINDIANHVATQLNQAKQKITEGKQQIHDYVVKLPENLRQVGQEAAQDIGSKFDELEQSVDNKQNELVDSLAQKYNENLQQLDAQLEEMKASNRTWMDKALDAVAAAIKTIAELKNLLMGVLAKAAGAIEKIILDPIGFLGNLVSGLKQGFENFMGNILEHLKKGMLGWLTGAMAGAGISMPETLDMKGIFSLVTQVLGTVYENIRPRAVKRMGENAVNFLESNFEMFVILKNEGIAGLWQSIQDQVGDLKVMVIDNIQNFVVDGIIKGGVMWVLSLLNPASAFVKACKAIYDIIMFFIERGSQIAELVNAVMESVTAIASGAVGGAAKLVENALSKALPVVISFMASLLNLGGISEKIQAIVQKVRQPIEKAIDWVISQAVTFAKKIGGKLGFGKDKKGKDNKDNKDGKLEDSEVGKTINFNAESESHRLWITTQGTSVTVMVASSPGSVEAKLNEWEGKLDTLAEDKRPQAKTLLATARQHLGNTEKEAQEAAKEIQEAKQKPNDQAVSEAEQADNQAEAAEQVLAQTMQQLFHYFGDQNSKLAEFFGVKEPFNAGNGESHSIYYEDRGGQPTLIVASTPRSIYDFLDFYTNEYDVKPQSPKGKLIVEIRSYLKQAIEPVVIEVNAAEKKKDTATQNSKQRKLLEKNTVLAQKLRELLAGDRDVGKIIDSYLLEGLTGTYSGIPNPHGDQLTPDHQPQAAILEWAAQQDFFDASGNMVRRAAGRARPGYAINLYENRHKEGRTYGPKGGQTKDAFINKASNKLVGVKAKQKKRDIVVDLMKVELAADVDAMKGVVGRANTNSVWDDINALNITQKEKNDLINKIRTNVLSGENQIASQDMESLKN
ncbi:DUF4157 domain-containing protein [Trichocoleus sp. FACHB-6]|nr:DUF4157 domain-containing protein [Trichocoleus sp. FACHB-832]MBD2065263.1 DUF4157 domain-containing protein [Trichocoleus sp. FACHB-6]